MAVEPENVSSGGFFAEKPEGRGQYPPNCAFSAGQAHLSTLAKPVNRKWGCAGSVTVGRKTMLLEIRYPVLAVVHFNVAIWVLLCLIKYDYIANLRNAGLLWHGLRSVSQQKGAVVTGVTRPRTIRCVKACGLHPKSTIHRAMVTGTRKRVSIHPLIELALGDGGRRP